MHGTSLSVGDTFTTTEQLSNDGFDGTTAHQGEAVATVGGDEFVLGGDGVFDTDGDGFLTGGQVTETADFLFFVQTIGVTCSRS